MSVIPLLFRDADFEFGSLSSPIPQARRKAIDRTIRSLQLNKELNTDFMVVWPGIDGFEQPFGANLADARRRFIDGLVEAMETVPGVRIAFEPKPYEPRGRILFGTTAEGLLLAERVEAQLQHPENRKLLDEGHALVCLNPEVGHMLMAYEDLAYSFSLILEAGRLAHTHWNAQPLGGYDLDLPVGMVAPEQLEEAAPLTGVITTGEGLARAFWRIVATALPAVRVRCVTVQETAKNRFAYRGEDG